MREASIVTNYKKLFMDLFGYSPYVDDNFVGAMDYILKIFVNEERFNKNCKRSNQEMDKIIRDKYGLDTGTPLTYKQIGEIYSISGNYIRNYLQARAYKKIRSYVYHHLTSIEPYLKRTDIPYQWGVTRKELWDKDNK